MNRITYRGKTIFTEHQNDGTWLAWMDGAPPRAGFRFPTEAEAMGPVRDYIDLMVKPRQR